METKEKHEYIVCPYDKMHVLESYRFQRHLLKCRRVHKDMKMGQCSFDATHIVPLHELQYHHSKCPARYRVEKDLMLKPSAPPAQQETFMDSAENWDDDENAPKVFMKLGADGFKAVVPKNKRSQRAITDVEGWLTGQHSLVGNMSEQDTQWTPVNTARGPQTKPRAMAGVTSSTPKAKLNNVPQVFLSAIGRGQRISVPSVPQSLIELGRGRGQPSNGQLDSDQFGNHKYGLGGYSSDSSTGSELSRQSVRCPVGRGHAFTQEIQANLESSVGRGRARNCPAQMSQSSFGTASNCDQLSSRAITTHDTDDAIQPSAEEQKKLIRKLRKKLSEIEILKKQQENGKLLDADQLTKIASWDEKMLMIQKLEDL